MKQEDIEKIRAALQDVVEQSGVYYLTSIDDVYNSADTAEEILRFAHTVYEHKEIFETVLSAYEAQEKEIDRLGKGLKKAVRIAKSHNEIEVMFGTHNIEDLEGVINGK